MRYTIKITYDTGDSVNHEVDVVNYLENPRGKLWVFESEEAAVDAVRRIGDHYTAYLDLKSIGALHFTPKQWSARRIEIASAPWYVPGKHETEVTGDPGKDSGEWHDHIKLIDNDGSEVIIKHPFWVGYFESLKEVEMEAMDSKVSFR